MLEAVDSWDIGALVGFVQMKLQRSYDRMNTAAIDYEYSQTFDDEERGEEEDKEVDAVTTTSCTCDISTLMGSGCNCGGK
jgi:hypothetical protein